MVVHRTLRRASPSSHALVHLIISDWFSFSCLTLLIATVCSRLIIYFFLQIKNVSSDVLQGKIGKIYIPDQKVGFFLS